MTVAALTSAIDYYENGVSHTFAAPFRFLTGTLTATRFVAGQEPAVLQYGTDFTVTGGETDAGGTLTLVTSVTGATLRIKRRTPRAQDTDYATGDRFPAESHEAALDRAMLIAQEEEDDRKALQRRSFLVDDGLVALPVDDLSAQDGKVLAVVDGRIGAVANDPASAASAAAAAIAAQGIAVAAKDVAVAAQTVVQASEIAVEADRVAAALSAGAAAASAISAGTAASAALASPARFYASTALGIAATVNGDYFYVVGAGATLASLYKNVAGVATSQNLDAPSLAGIPKIIVGGVKNQFDLAGVVAGTEVYADGTLAAQANSSISALIFVKGLAAITVSGLQPNAGFNRYYRFLAADKVTVVGTGNIPDGSNSGSITVPPTGIYFQFSPKQRIAAAGAYGAVQVEEGTHATAYEAFKPLVRGIDGNAVPGAQVALTGDINLFDKTNYTSGFEVYGDGTLSAEANSVISHLIPCLGFASLAVSGLQANPGFARYYRFLGVDGVTVVGVGQIAAGLNAATFAVNAGAAWFQFSPRQRYAAANNFATAQVEEGATYSPYQAFSPRVYSVNGTALRGGSKVADAWGGGEYLLFGDSITETSNVDAADHAYDSVFRANWPKTALPLLKVSAGYNYARAGAAFNSTPAIYFQKFENQITQAIADGRTPSRIIVALGTNDFGNSVGVGGGVVLGSYASAMAKTIAALDKNIAMEAMRSGLYRIQDQWPSATKFIVLPIQRADFTLDQMTPWLTEMTLMAGRYGFAVIDGQRESGIVKDFETVGVAGDDLYDGLHPGATGIDKLGRLIAARVKARLS